MLLNMVEMLKVAKENNFAVGAFNVSDSNLFRSVVEAAEENNAPAIIAVHPTELDYAKDEFFQYVLTRVKNSKVPFVVHLDHGDNLASVVRAIHCGFSSVMIDGSLLDFQTNIDITKEVSHVCHQIGVSVEGELGTIGSTGTSVEGGVTEVTYTKPEDAKKFITETGVDTLAVAIGTAHGIYPKGVTPKLKMEVLEELVKVTELPLVLHGGSANPDSEIAKAVKIGIQKVNISSDYKYAFFKKARQVLSETELWDPNNIYPECINEAKKVIRHKMELFDSVGKADLYQNSKVKLFRSEFN